jgi:hypothetical protein
MTVYMGDQPTGCPVVEGCGFIGSSAAQTLASQISTSSAPVYVFSAYYVTVWNGSTLAFRPAMAYQLDPALLSYLTAANAPMVAA